MDGYSIICSNWWRRREVARPVPALCYRRAHLNIPAATHGSAPASEMGPDPKIGRNDPCPCGSKKKWKHCGLLNTEEHQMNMAQGGAKHEVTGG